MKRPISGFGRGMALASALFVGLCAAGPAAYGEGQADFARLLEHTPGSKRNVDHGPWQNVLDAYVMESSAGTRIAYDAVPKKGRDHIAAYIRFLEVMPWDELSRNEQLAAWINLYNALSVKILLESPPKRRSSSLLTPPATTRGPFARKRLTIRGVLLSAEDIRQQILRPGWHDARILYALHGAALGGPSLSATAYRGAEIDLQLEKAARRFVNAPRSVSKGWRGLKLSQLYEWYAEDFGGNPQAILEHVRGFANKRTARKLDGQTEIKGYRYDWAVDRHIQRQPDRGEYNGGSPIRGS